jgi:hypothetical protein
VVAAPRTGLDCDGRGGCCRLYDRLMLTADDVGRIHQAYGPDEHTPGGLYRDSAVLRHRDDRQPELYELAVVDGACVFLESDARCGLHARLGAAGKPTTCRIYPLRDVLLDDQLQVGVAVECRCVIDFADGPPLDGAAAEVLARRRAYRSVEAVAAEVPITVERTVPRAEYRALTAAALARLEAADDLAEWAVAEAAGLLGAPPRPAARVLGALGGLLDAIEQQLDFDALDTAEIYGAADLQRQSFAWGVEAARRLVAALADGRTPPPARGERVLARQLLFTHGLLRARSWATGLVGLALRLWLARAADGLELARELLPVTTAEYLYRCHGLGRLVDQHAARIEELLHAPLV